MSKLNEQFGNVVLGTNHNSDCVKIAETFSCGFGNWLLQNHDSMKLYMKSDLDNCYIRKPMIDILEIYKKEKGL